jgi:hypothetical protein
MIGVDEELNEIERFVQESRKENLKLILDKNFEAGVRLRMNMSCIMKLALKSRWDTLAYMKKIPKRPIGKRVPPKRGKILE